MLQKKKKKKKNELDVNIKGNLDFLINSRIEVLNPVSASILISKSLIKISFF